MREFQVIIDGVTYDVQVSETTNEEKEQSFIPMAKIEQKDAQKAEAKPAAKAEAKPAAEAKANPAAKVSGDGTALKAPMPGMILNFKVANGTAVKKGQTVLSLEAMKMENDIVANADGVITFAVQKGSTVNAGAVLAYIK